MEDPFDLAKILNFARFAERFKIDLKPYGPPAKFAVSGEYAKPVNDDLRRGATKQIAFDYKCGALEILFIAFENKRELDRNPVRVMPDYLDRGGLNESSDLLYFLAAFYHYSLPFPIVL